MIDRDVSHFSSGARLSSRRQPSVRLNCEGMSPAVLRDLSRLLLAHARNLRGDTAAARLRAAEHRAMADRALRPAEAKRQNANHAWGRVNRYS
jgi:hypothetical protein